MVPVVVPVWYQKKWHCTEKVSMVPVVVPLWYHKVSKVPYMCQWYRKCLNGAVYVSMVPKIVNDTVNVPYMLQWFQKWYRICVNDTVYMSMVPKKCKWYRICLNDTKSDTNVSMIPYVCQWYQKSVKNWVFYVLLCSRSWLLIFVVHICRPLTVLPFTILDGKVRVLKQHSHIGTRQSVD
jgi:hypothetical protein